MAKPEKIGIVISSLRRTIPSDFFDNLQILEVEQLLEILRELNCNISDNYYIMGHVLLALFEIAKEKGIKRRDIIKEIMKETKLSKRTIYNLVELAQSYSPEEYLRFPNVPMHIKLLGIMIKDKKERIKFLEHVADHNLSFRKAKEYLREKLKLPTYKIISVSLIGFWDAEKEILITPEGPIDVIDYLNQFDNQKIKIEIKMEEIIKKEES